MTLPDHVGLLVLAGCAVIAIALVAAGIIRVVRETLALKRRVLAYADLPLREDFRLAGRRIALAERRIDTIPVLTARAERAVAEIDAARARIRLMGMMVVDRFRRRPVRR